MTQPTSTSKRFELALQSSVQWIRTHQEQFWSLAGTGFGAVLLVFFMIHRRQTENEEAWIQLGTAQGTLLQGQLEQSRKALDQWTSRFQGTDATSYAKFLRAELLYRTSDYVQAAGVYGDLAQNGRPADLRPLALSAQSAAEEMAGHIALAQVLIQQFLDHYPDHFLSASMFISQARLAEMSGNVSGATAIYDRFAVLYPQSPWTAFARNRLQSLTGKPITPPIQK